MIIDDNKVLEALDKLPQILPIRNILAIYLFPHCHVYFDGMDCFFFFVSYWQC